MKVLFVGNSHTYFNDMPLTFKEIWDAVTCTGDGVCVDSGDCAGVADDVAGDAAEITMLAYSYKSVNWHSDEYFALRFALLYGNYDVCIIQQCAHPFPGYEETKAGIETILRLCEKTGTAPYIYLPWAEKRMPENQEKLTAAMTRIAKEGCPKGSPCKLVPVGLVWEQIRNSRPDIELFWKDGEHASVTGDYLIAAVMAMTLANDFRPNAKIDWKTVLPRKAHDFTNGADIDFDHPTTLIEDPSETVCEISDDAILAISKAYNALTL